MSKDLVHWRDLPVLRGMGGMTGQLKSTGEQALMTFSAGDGVSLATSEHPLLLTWDKRLILLKDGPLKEYQVPVYSDIWRKDNTWYVTVRKHWWDNGLWHLNGTKPTLGMFSSENLKDWEPNGIFFEDDTYTQPGDDMACPNFAPLGNGRHLLLWYCHPRGPMYSVGTYNDHEQRFVQEKHGRMSYGPTKRGTLHAPSAFVDPDGRCIAIFNATENRPHEENWIGTMSLPRQISLNEEYLNPINESGMTPEQGNLDQGNVRNFISPLRIEPIAELESLRFNQKSIDEFVIPANDERILSGIEGKAIELEVIIDPKDAREVGLNVLRSPDGKEQTTIRFYAHGWERSTSSRFLSIDVSDASLDPLVKSRSPEMGPLYLAEEERLHLRISIDRSIIEVFANDRQCLTLRTYPNRSDSKGVSVFAKGSYAELVSLKAWKMRSIWPELIHLMNYSPLTTLKRTRPGAERRCLYLMVGNYRNRSL